MSRWKQPEDSITDGASYMRVWSQTEQGLAYKKRHNEYVKKWRVDNKERFKATKNVAYDKVRMECFEAYGGPICRCCQETMVEFLHLDHKNGDGSKMRREIKEKEGLTINGGTQLYWYLKKRDFPQDIGLQVLCANCNLGKRTGRYCPHEIRNGIDLDGNPIEASA